MREVIDSGDRIDVGREVVRRIEPIGDGSRAREANDGIVDRIRGVRDERLIASLEQRERGVEENRLRPGRDDDIVGARGDAVRCEVIRDRGAQLQQSAGGTVFRLAVVQGAHGGLDDVRRGREIGLADLEVEDVLPLLLQRARAREHVEGAFGTEAIDARCERELNGGRRWLWSSLRGGTDAKNPGGNATGRFAF